MGERLLTSQLHYPRESIIPSVPVPLQERIVSTLEPALPYVVLGWLVGVFGLSTWHLGGWVQLQRLRRRMVREIGRPLQQRLEELSVRLGVHRAVGLLESALIEVPTVVGWLRPVILLPASALTGLRPSNWRRSSPMNWRTSAATITWSTSCKRWSRSSASTIRPSGGSRAGFASSGRIAATIWPYTSAAAHCNTPEPWPAWRKSATAAASWPWPPRAAVSWPASPACSAGPPSMTGVSPGCPASSPCCSSSVVIIPAALVLGTPQRPQAVEPTAVAATHASAEPNTAPSNTESASSDAQAAQIVLEFKIVKVLDEARVDRETLIQIANALGIVLPTHETRPVEPNARPDRRRDLSRNTSCHSRCPKRPSEALLRLLQSQGSPHSAVLATCRDTRRQTGHDSDQQRTLPARVRPVRRDPRGLSTARP